MANGANDGGNLSPDAKAEIHRYLWKLAAPFGITNLVAILVGLAYIFFVLPNVRPGSFASGARLF